MSIERSITVVCDSQLTAKCFMFNTTDGRYTGDARDAAAANGWRFIGGKDICLKCLDHIRQEAIDNAKASA